MSPKEPLLLLIDIGNTRIKWACVKETMSLDQFDALAPFWYAQGSVQSSELASLSLDFQSFSIDRVCISNVASDDVFEEIKQRLGLQFPLAEISQFFSSDQCAGLKNHYKEPKQLGSDRFASAIAAHFFFPNQAIVIATCGTATTVDAVSEDGAFIGGMILPGLQVMTASLAKNTANLPQVSTESQLNAVFATDTTQAIISGCLHAQIGAIEMALDTLHGTSTQRHPKLVISGGAALYLLPNFSASTQKQMRYLENLVLIGLMIVAKSKNAPKSISVKTN